MHRPSIDRQPPEWFEEAGPSASASPLQVLPVDKESKASELLFGQQTDDHVWLLAARYGFSSSLCLPV
jgi:hypothetical protein